VVLGTTLVITVATVIGSLLADILYAAADPRIRLGGS
jgi:peptide/nickel transport system permease protein